jgi:hypothetical protein
MSTPYTGNKPMHPHRDLIIAWANGAEIQQYTENRWKDCTYPVWDERVEYRIKPVPKLDYRMYFVYHKDRPCIYPCEPNNLPNLVLCFDGETGKLKDAEVIKE